MQRHWRLRDLAQVSGVSKATLTYIEGGHIPTLRNAIRIATALDVSVYQIWSPRSIVKSD
jgi:transcriptional regulator with XRE-family HTH domain